MKFQNHNILQALNFVFLGLLIALTITGCDASRNSKSESWCVGTWQGTIAPDENFTVRIRDDGTCKVVLSSSRWEADFEAEWEPVAENKIKIYDYVGHYQHHRYIESYSGNVNRWSMFLEEDGEFYPKNGRPVGHLHKR